MYLLSHFLFLLKKVHCIASLKVYTLGFWALVMGPHCIDVQNCHLLTLIVQITLMRPILLCFSYCLRLVPPQIFTVVVLGDFIRSN